MIVASLLLVIAAAVTLLIGLLNRETLEWVYVSIGCCLLAGLLLTIGVLRSRPSRKPVLQSGGEGQGASWAGASQWGGAADAGAGGTDLLSRDDEEHTDETTVTGNEDPTRTSLSTTPAPDDEADPWAPPAAADEDTGDVRVVSPPPPEEAAPEPTDASPAPAEEPEDDVIVVPKPSARDAGAMEQPDGTAAPEPSAPVSATRASTTPKAAAPQAAKTDDAARFEQVLRPIAGVGPGKRAALAAHFGTYRKLRAASVDKLAAVPGISRTLAQRIHDALHTK